GAKKRAKKTPTPPPAGRRRVVGVEADVSRLFADDLSGAKHQQFTVIPVEIITADERVRADVTATIDGKLEVRLAVRFGDSRGLPDRLPGIRTALVLHINAPRLPPP